MKPALVIILIVLNGFLFAQQPSVTSSFSVSGEVKNPTTFTIADLQKFKATDVGDVVITNHLGEKKSESKKLKGILLRDVLATIQVSASSPKVLSEYYFVCKASDGYMVVYSWNELFNTSVGESAYIITEKEGKGMAQMDDSILMLSAKDFKTGRRQLKALSTIEVKHAQ